MQLGLVTVCHESGRSSFNLPFKHCPKNFPSMSCLSENCGAIAVHFKDASHLQNLLSNHSFHLQGRKL